VITLQVAIAVYVSKQLNTHQRPAARVCCTSTEQSITVSGLTVSDTLQHPVEDS